MVARHRDLPEMGAQPAHREQRPGLHGAQRESGPLGDLRLGETVEVHPFDHLALLFGQRAERRSTSRRSPGRSIACQHVVDGILDDARPQSRRLLGTAPLRLLPSHGIDRPMVDGAHEPGADRPPGRVVAIRVPPDGEERFLHDLLRDLGLPDQPEGEGVGHGRVSAEELAERLLVSGDDALEQILVPGVRRLSGTHGDAPRRADRHRCARDTCLPGDPMVAGGIRSSSTVG